MKQSTIEADTAILPLVVADTVACEAMKLTGSNKPRKLAKSLAKRADVIYNCNTVFRTNIQAKGNKGRDYLYMFMRHWISADIKKKYPDLFRKIPQTFCNGIFGE